MIKNINIIIFIFLENISHLWTNKRHIYLIPNLDNIDQISKFQVWPMNILVLEVILYYPNIRLIDKYFLRFHYGSCLSSCSVPNLDFSNTHSYISLLSTHYNEI